MKAVTCRGASLVCYVVRRRDKCCLRDDGELCVCNRKLLLRNAHPEHAKSFRPRVVHSRHTPRLLPHRRLVDGTDLDQRAAVLDQAGPGWK